MIVTKSVTYYHDIVLKLSIMMIDLLKIMKMFYHESFLFCMYNIQSHLVNFFALHYAVISSYSNWKLWVYIAYSYACLHRLTYIPKTVKILGHKSHCQSSSIVIGLDWTKLGYSFNRDVLIMDRSLLDMRVNLRSSFIKFFNSKPCINTK